MVTDGLSGCTLKCKLRSLKGLAAYALRILQTLSLPVPGARPIAGRPGQSKVLPQENSSVWYSECIMSAAACAYRAYCQRQGSAYQVPDWARSGIEGRHAVLRNGGSVLARFKITKHAGHYQLQRAD